MGHSQKVAKKHYLHVLTGQYNIALDFDKEKEQNEKTQQEEQSKTPSPETCNEPEQQNDDLK